MKKITKTIRGYTFDWHSEKEIVTMFLPDVKDILQRKILERQESYTTQRKFIKSKLNEIQQEPAINIPAYEALINIFLISKLLEEERQLLRLKRFFTLCLPSSTQKLYDESFEEIRNRVKNYPIESLARSRLELKPSGKNFIGLCPFHQEKTPSFYLYTATNSFYCFGCNKGGDVITLTMYLHGISFADAVQMLK